MLENNFEIFVDSVQSHADATEHNIYICTSSDYFFGRTFWYHYSKISIHGKEIWNM